MPKKAAIRKTLAPPLNADYPAKPVDAKILAQAVAQRVQDIRHERRFTIDHCAKTAGVSSLAWHYFESGISITLDKLPKIAAALGVALCDLIPNDPQTPKHTRHWLNEYQQIAKNAIVSHNKSDWNSAFLKAIYESRYRLHSRVAWGNDQPRLQLRVMHRRIDAGSGPESRETTGTNKVCVIQLDKDDAVSLAMMILREFCSDAKVPIFSLTDAIEGAVAT